jgi:hypothetical protein
MHFRFNHSFYSEEMDFICVKVCFQTTIKYLLNFYLDVDSAIFPMPVTFPICKVAYEYTVFLTTNSLSDGLENVSFEQSEKYLEKKRMHAKNLDK